MKKQAAAYTYKILDHKDWKGNAPNVSMIGSSFKTGGIIRPGEKIEIVPGTRSKVVSVLELVKQTEVKTIGSIFMVELKR